MSAKVTIPLRLTTRGYRQELTDLEDTHKLPKKVVEILKELISQRDTLLCSILVESAKILSLVRRYLAAGIFLKDSFGNERFYAIMVCETISENQSQGTLRFALIQLWSSEERLKRLEEFGGAHPTKMAPPSPFTRHRVHGAME